MRNPTPYPAPTAAYHDRNEARNPRLNLHAAVSCKNNERHEFNFIINFKKSIKNETFKLSFVFNDSYYIFHD